jgi:hypothetical protein
MIRVKYGHERCPSDTNIEIVADALDDVPSCVEDAQLDERRLDVVGEQRRDHSPRVPVRLR